MDSGEGDGKRREGKAQREEVLGCEENERLLLQKGKGGRDSIIRVILLFVAAAVVVVNLLLLFRRNSREFVVWYVCI